MVAAAGGCGLVVDSAATATTAAIGRGCRSSCAVSRRRSGNFSEVAELEARLQQDLDGDIRCEYGVRQDAGEVVLDGKRIHPHDGSLG